MVEPPATVALTASVSQAPSEHRGKGRFTLRIAFSEAVKGTARAAKGTIQVTGGTRAARGERGPVGARTPALWLRGGDAVARREHRAVGQRTTALTVGCAGGQTSLGDTAADWHSVAQGTPT